MPALHKTAPDESAYKRRLMDVPVRLRVPYDDNGGVALTRHLVWEERKEGGKEVGDG